MSTICKVAERAGVSRTTVSHVINHADRVSQSLRERVQAAIDELGYAPNPQAQSLRTGRTNIVAMLIPDIRNPFYPELVKTAQSRARERVGLDTLIFNTDVPGGHSQEHGREYLRQIGRKRVDGLIVGDFALHGMHDALLDLDMPTVFIGHLPNHAVDSVKLDDFGGGYLMGEYLARKGHKRVAHVTGPSFFQRGDGARRRLRARACRPRRRRRTRRCASRAATSRRRAARRSSGCSRSTAQHLPTAVFFANYLMASGALAEFYDRGIRVPEDIAVAVFDDLPQLEYVRPKLTRVGNSPTVLAERAAAMLIDRLDGKFERRRRAPKSCRARSREFDTA